MSSGPVRRFRRAEEGAALVEAALVLPVLLALVLALADLSLYAWEAGLARKAAALGARMAATSDSVAVGPGLTPEESASYWFGLMPGERCGLDTTACPVFGVECGAESGCLCLRGACRFTFSAEKLAPILATMRAVLPGLAPRNVQIAYATNGIGFVGRPPPVPVDVTVRIVDWRYEAVFLGLLFDRAPAIAAAATAPSEDLLGPARSLGP